MLFLARFSVYIFTNNLRLIIIAFFSLQFGYFPCAWIFHIRSLKSQINKLQERALRLVHKDITSYFDELLKERESFHNLSEK